MKVIKEYVDLADVAVIGGTGAQDSFFKPDDPTEHVAVQTPFGLTTQIILGKIGGTRVCFLPRHGFPGKAGGTKIPPVPPHSLNPKAYILAKRSSYWNTEESTTEGEGVSPGVPLDAIKNTLGESIAPPMHRPMTGAFCIDIRAKLCDVLREKVMDKGYPAEILRTGGTYIQVRGPRFETEAEIHAVATLGADVVGMTVGPEVVLARELGMCYTCVATITNFAGGIGGEADNHEEVIKLSNRMNSGVVLPSISAVAKALGDAAPTCQCAQYAKQAPPHAEEPAAKKAKH